ncbi:N-6 DNA methylase [Prevotella copri]|uniref:N-6 DNA methylase n=2 Tax=Segatella TaxID=2974251 RepID=UPI00223278F9|nr:N-6 DNA methylase [Segatella copri]MCW4081421.1 N-6 DNA methylase [Segatella copri]MCW4106551.1 N-6 DNA methylase [Segatella copri]
MITKDNIQKVLLELKFISNHGVYTRHFGSADEGFDLEYNFNVGEFIYPDGVQADRNTTQDEHQNESFVVFVCVAQLFERGYLPQHIKLEGRNYAGTDKGYCDILVSDNNGEPYLIIECKTANIDKKEDQFRKHWARTMRDGDQLFRYFNTYRKAQYLCMYAADCPEYRKKGDIIYRLEINYHIISLVDNEEYLQTDNKLHSFQEMREQQGGSEDFFNVWKQTYKQDFTTRGLFEEGIDAFNIGKKSYGVNDLKTIDEYSLDKKYNEFALILRKHTISSHENAFDKLVNLFLAKIIDERYHSNELQLLWKGAAYDDYFSLQDRLINLYKRGMKEFFDDEVASVENAEIENAFKFLTSKADEARDTIKRYFRKLKYFNNNPFAFLDVHNEQLFYKNAVILKDTISMLQDIYLTKNTDNQFLGDLFEGFLNRGVHQSEGQFFTPIPIVRFLVSSLPLRQILEGGEIPKVIDYACGAGHFLTEYARQIKPIVEELAHLENIYDKRAKEERLISVLREYYEQIVGIEKDYRLSKVSQVAAFMYGMDGIHIHYGDGLQEMSGIQDHTFSVLVANPPYSVSGFLETLPEEDRERYTLNNYISNIEKNNSIETFFIERAAQLLKSGGVAAIVLPASVLSGTGLYMYTREILLKNFDVVGICCFDKKTFGQTSTRTITLFLRRKDLEPDFAKHLDNRIESWFTGNTSDDTYYKDSDKINSYIERMGYKKEDYRKFLNGELTESFMESEMVKDYLKALNIKKQTSNANSIGLNSRAKKVRDEAQKFIKSRSYKDLTPAGKLQEELRFTLRFIREIEKEKLNYFLLAASNPQPVLLVQSPTDKDQEKSFLGYEWSNRKGDEGIHYLNTGKLKKASSDDEDADDDTIRQIKGVNGISTPLFNPMDINDVSKINSLVRANFNKENLELNEGISKFVSMGNLVDMMDFSRVIFTKEIKTSFLTKQIFFDDEKFEMKALATIATFIQRGKNPVYGEEGIQVIKSGQARGGIEFDFSKVYFATNYDSEDKRILKKGDILINSTGVGTAGRVTLFDLNGKYAVDNHITILRTKNGVDNLYVFYTLAYGIGFKNIEAMAAGTSGQIELSVSTIQNIKIPLPPIDIQKKIVEECEKIDQVVTKNKEMIREMQTNMEAIISSLEGLCQPLKTIMCYGKERISYSAITPETYVSTDNMEQNCEGIVPYNGTPNVNTIVAYQKGDILLSNIRPYLKKLWLANCNGGCSPDVLVLHNNRPAQVDSSFIYYSLRRQGFFDFIMSDIKGMKMPRGKKETIEKFEIILPSLDKQKEVVEKMSKIDEEISKAKQYVANAYSAKQAILDKYLK